jgi:hypothetical protein
MIALSGADIVLPDRIVQGGSIVIDQGRIAAIERGRSIRAPATPSSILPITPSCRASWTFTSTASKASMCLMAPMPWTMWRSGSRSTASPHSARRRWPARRCG